MFLPLLDDKLFQLDKRFSKQNESAIELAFLLPSNCHKTTHISEEELKEIIGFYEVDLFPICSLTCAENMVVFNVTGA